MLSIERSSEVVGSLIDYGHWHVRELQLDGEKVRWLWHEMQKYPSLFSDLTRNNEQVFLNMIQDKFSYWLEVVSDDGAMIGLLYVTDLYKGIDANVHLLFLDRKPTEKSMLVREMIKLIFDKFPYLHRLTAVVPDIYHATIRLAKRTGFVQEGRKRQALMIRRKWCDEIIFGILSGDL